MTTAPALHVIALGNAIVDVIAPADDGFLHAQGLAKGTMTLIDDDRAHGQDERLPVDSYFKSLDFFYSFAKDLGGE